MASSSTSPEEKDFVHWLEVYCGSSLSSAIKDKLINQLKENKSKTILIIDKLLQ